MNGETSGISTTWLVTHITPIQNDPTPRLMQSSECSFQNLLHDQTRTEYVERFSFVWIKTETVN